MPNGDLPQRQASYEHLFGRGHHGTRGLRLGLLAAVTIHLGVFAITWPTLAETKPEFTPSPPRVCRLVQPVTFEPSRPIIEVPQLTGQLVPAPGPPGFLGLTPQDFAQLKTYSGLGRQQR